jgi:hypothetical protein
MAETYLFSICPNRLPILRAFRVVALQRMDAQYTVAEQFKHCIYMQHTRLLNACDPHLLLLLLLLLQVLQDALEAPCQMLELLLDAAALLHHHPQSSCKHSSSSSSSAEAGTPASAVAVELLCRMAAAAGWCQLQELLLRLLQIATSKRHRRSTAEAAALALSSIYSSNFQSYYCDTPRAARWVHDMMAEPCSQQLLQASCHICGRELAANYILLHQYQHTQQHCIKLFMQCCTSQVQQQVQDSSAG